MRVISQDGTIDMPYEEVLITLGCSGDKREYHINGHLIYPEGSSSVKIATYSTEEKAKKAMEMLRERHTDNVFCREDIQYKAEIMLDEGLDIVREMMMKCEYFRFPKDDEVKA